PAPVASRRVNFMSKRLQRHAALAMVLMTALAIPALSASPQVVTAELWNKPDGSQGVTLSTNHVKPGVVQFKVKNVSTDEDHELRLAKPDPPNDLRRDADGGHVEEDKLKGHRERGDGHGGKTRTKAAPLAAGKYVLFCNEAGHFKEGMFAAFTVEP